MKKKRISDLFYNNRFLMIFSVVVAVVFWLVVNVEYAPETTNVIKNVKVTIDTETPGAMGLELFGQKDFYVDVTVSGKRYIVDSEDNIRNDLLVSAKSDIHIDSAGEYYLNIGVSSKNSRADYEIVSYTSNAIKVFFDYPRTEEYEIIPVIGGDHFVADGYYQAPYIIPENSKTVKIFGPRSETNRIEKVVATATLDGELKENKSVKATINAVTVDGESTQYLTYSIDSVDITIPVYKIATLDVDVSFTDIPSSYINGSFPFTYTVSPSKANVAVSENYLNGLDKLEICSISFTSVNTGVNEIVIKASDLKGIKVLDGTEEFTVKIYLNYLDSRKIQITEDNASVSYRGLPKGMTAELLSLEFEEMTVIGNPESLSAIESEGATLTVDMSGVEKNRRDEYVVPVKLSSSDCWSYGEYTAKVIMS